MSVIGIILLVNCINVLNAFEYNGFDDSVLHTINWQGAKEKIDVVKQIIIIFGFLNSLKMIYDFFFGRLMGKKKLY